jgi:hypothetical protein
VDYRSPIGPTTLGLCLRHKVGQGTEAKKYHSTTLCLRQDVPAPEPPTRSEEPPARCTLCEQPGMGSGALSLLRCQGRIEPAAGRV